MVLNRNERARVATRLEDSITCVPIGHQQRLTENEVHLQLEVARVVIHYDEQTGWSWLRGEDQYAASLKTQVKSKSLKGFTTREVQRHGGEWNRLKEKLEEEIESRKALQSSQLDQAELSPASTPSPHLPTEADRSSEPVTTLGTTLGEDGPSVASESSAPSSPSARHSPVRTFPGVTRSGVSDGKTQVSKSVAPPPKRPRTDAKSEGSTSVPTSLRSGPSTPPRQPGPPSPFDKLAFEMITAILKLCFKGVESTRDHLRILHTLYWVGGPIRHVLSQLPSLWTKLHPTSSILFSTTVMERSRDHHLSIEYHPKSERSKSSWQGFERYIRLVEEARDRWESVNISVHPKSFGVLTQAFEIPAPILHSLRLSVSSTGYSNDSPLLVERPLSTQVGRSFQLLGGEQGNLRRLEIRNAPCIFDPKPFGLLTSLVLADGVRISYENLLVFLATSTQLQQLSLADVKFVAVEPHELDQPIVLSHLKQLVLKEEVERTGIIDLYHSIRATNCEKLSLEVQGVDHLLGPKLVEGVAPVIRKTFETQNQTVLRFRYHHRLNAASWEGEGESNNGGHLCSFHLGFIDDGLAQAIIFPDFASRVLPLVGGSTEIKLNVEDTLSGTIRGTIGFDDVQATPTLFPNLFESLTVTEVVADVVDGYLCYLKEFVAPDCRKGFPRLRCITLRTIPSDEVVVDPDSTVRCSLEDFIDTVSQAYYEVASSDKVPVEKRNSLTVTLEGRFGVAAATISDLGDGGDVERAGIRINRSRGSVYCINPTM
ncbi:hypothetical protein FRC04_004614 [Tulasnella sp. 424]|nr:hypothetical protein FRC04_004614 [Tulasnella sp. 424]